MKANRLCFGCLRPGHMKRDCRHRHTCKTCHKRHPTILHVEDSDWPLKNTLSSWQQTDTDDETSPKTTAKISIAPQCHAQTESDCTLAIIPVKVRMKNSMKNIATYAFLDPGSTISFCTEALRQELGITGRKMNITLDTMGSSHTMSTYVLNNLEISDLSMSNIIELPNVYTKDKMPVSGKHIPSAKDIQ